jgi:hypothetical protein
MGWQIIGDAEVATDKGGTTTLFTKFRDNLEYLYNNIADAALNLLNGGFESYDPDTFAPTSWTETKVNATGVVDVPYDGSEGRACYKMTQTGSGGYVELLSNFIDVDSLDDFIWECVAKRTDTGTHLIIKMQCYDQDKANLNQDKTLFDTNYDTLAAGSQTSISGSYGILAGSWLSVACKFVKIYMKLGGGSTSNKVVEVDDIQFHRVRKAAVVPGTTSRATGTSGDIEATTFTKMGGDLTIPAAGFYRIYWEWKCVSGQGYMRVHRNGYAYGAVHEVDSSSTVFWPTMEVLYFDEGDTVNIYGKHLNSSGDHLYQQNFAAYGDVRPVIAAAKVA